MGWEGERVGDRQEGEGEGGSVGIDTEEWGGRGERVEIDRRGKGVE